MPLRNFAKYFARFSVIFFLLFFSARNILFSQSFNAGLRFGMSASQVDGDQLEGFDKAGIIAGGFVSRDFSNHFTMQMEMVYIQKGSRKPVDDNNTYYVMRVHYIEVPVLALWHFSKKFSLTAGPSFGTLVFSEEEDQYGTYNNSTPFEKFEFAANVGFLYKLSDRWVFDGRYSRSLATIREFPGSTSTYFDKGQYNVLIELSFLYFFR
jgi:hypothetical protein